MYEGLEYTDILGVLSNEGYTISLPRQSAFRKALGAMIAAYVDVSASFGAFRGMLLLELIEALTTLLDTSSCLPLSSCLPRPLTVYSV